MKGELVMTDYSSSNFLNLISRISENLNPSENFVNTEYISRFQKRCSYVAENIDTILNTDRNLKIGIVGEVKAGKSSFLNALIFNGENILPQAATPMTAALTKLTYSHIPGAKVVFYTDYDWQQIETLSNKYDERFLQIYQQKFLKQQPECKESYNVIKKVREEFLGTTSDISSDNIDDMIKNSIDEQINPQYRACKELTTMVYERQLPLGELLNATSTVKITDVEKDLEKYVGASGEFTPLVKHIELGLKNEFLKGFEIIDTPGLNDPILSRSDTTKNFLMNCDLVFLLSYSGQFLNSEDINFIANTLPSESIQHAVLVGSKFDSAILDFPTKRRQLIPFEHAAQKTQDTLNFQAKTDIEKCLKMSSFNNSNSVLNKLMESLPPYYISSLLYSAAQKLTANIELSEYENHIIKTIQKRFDGFVFTPDILFNLSNIEKVKRESFDKIYEEKQKILEQKSKNTIRTERSNFLTLLEEINIQATQNLIDLQRYDKGKLEDKLKSINTNLNSMRKQVKTIFEMCAIESKKYIGDLSIDIKCVVKNYTDIQIKERQETRHRSYQEGWWIFKRTKYYTENVTINTVSVHEVISNIREYINRAQQIINDDLGKAINIAGVQKKIKDCVLQAFDLSDTNFDENDILAPLELIFQKLVLPKVAIDAGDYNEMILRSFSSAYVEGNEIHALMLKQEEVLQNVTKDICMKLQQTGEEIESILKEQAATFLDDVHGHLSANIQSLQAHLQDKENSIGNYAKFIENIQKYKDELRAFGGK